MISASSSVIDKYILFLYRCLILSPSLTSPVTPIIALGLTKLIPVPNFIEVINMDGDTAGTLLKSDEVTVVASQIFYKGLRESMNT